MRTIALLLAVTGAITLGACGGSDKKDSSSSSGGGSTPAATTAQTSTDSGGGSSSSGNTQVDAAVQAAIDSCKQSVSAAPNLKDDVKADLNNLCEKAASGNVEDAKKASKEVCLKIVDSSGVPDGTAKDQAKAACNSIDAS